MKADPWTVCRPVAMWHSRQAGPVTDDFIARDLIFVFIGL